MFNIESKLEQTKFAIAGERLHTLNREVENCQQLISYMELVGKDHRIDCLIDDNYSRKLKTANRRFTLYKQMCKKNPLIEMFLY